MEDRPVVLVGMMGAGKSAVGRVLAERLRRPFADADEVLERQAGRPIPQLFATEGEDGFRDREARVLDELLTTRPPLVVATGGGVVVRPANRRALRDRAVVVWLRAPVEELQRRVGSGRGRPLLAGDPAGTLARLEAERSPWYAEVADLTIDTPGRWPRDLADDLAAALQPAGATATTAATTGEGRR